MTYEFYAFSFELFSFLRHETLSLKCQICSLLIFLRLFWTTIRSLRFVTVWCSLVTSILKLLNTKSYLNLFSRTGFSVAFISCLTLYLSLVRWGCLWVYDYLIIISLFLSVMAWENWFLHQSLSSSNDKAPLTLTLI